MRRYQEVYETLHKVLLELVEYKEKAESVEDFRGFMAEHGGTMESYVPPLSYEEALAISVEMPELLDYGVPENNSIESKSMRYAIERIYVVGIIEAIQTKVLYDGKKFMAEAEVEIENRLSQPKP